MGDRRHRICHVHLLPLMSGPQHSTIELFKHLSTNRYELHVILGQPGEFQERLEESGVTVHIVPSLTRGIAPLTDARALRDVTRLFQHERYDLVHTHSSKTGIIGRLAARVAGVRAIVHHVRGFAFHEFSSPLARLAFPAIEWVGARASHHVIFVNEEERLWAEHRGVVPLKRSCTIYNGADLAMYCPEARLRLRGDARAQFGIGADQAVIAFVGRLWEQKNPKLLVPTLIELRKRHPQLDPVLLVAGDGPYRDDVIRAARAGGVGARVIMLGWRSDVAAVMSAADAVFLPSLWEGLPRTLIESACLGIPAVAADVKGNREVIRPEETGLLVTPDDAAAAAAALGRILTAPAAAAAMGEAAATRGRSLFDARETARRVEQIYRQLLRAPAGAAVA